MSFKKEENFSKVLVKLANWTLSEEEIEDYEAFTNLLPFL